MKFIKIMQIYTKCQFFQIDVNFILTKTIIEIMFIDAKVCQNSRFHRSVRIGVDQCVAKAQIISSEKIRMIKKLTKLFLKFKKNWSFKVKKKIIFKLFKKFEKL